MTLIKFYIHHGLRWLIFDRINVILILLSLVVPFLSVLSINNVYASDTVYGLNAIDIQYRWYQKYQGPLDSVSFDTILSDTMVEPLNVSVAQLVETIQKGKKFDALEGMSRKDILLNLISDVQDIQVFRLCTRLFDDDLNVIHLSNGYTIPQSGGMYALVSDILPIMLTQAFVVLLIICRSVDHLHLSTSLPLEKTYVNGKRLHGLYWIDAMVYIIFMYGYTIGVLLMVYTMLYHGLGTNGSFALWSATIQTPFNGLTIGSYFNYLVLSYFFLVLIALNLFMIFALKFNGVIASVLSSIVMMLIFSLLSDVSYSGIGSLVYGLFILSNRYTYFQYSYGLTMTFQLIQAFVWWSVSFGVLLHVYRRLRI